MRVGRPTVEGMENESQGKLYVSHVAFMLSNYILEE